MRSATGTCGNFCLLGIGLNVVVRTSWYFCVPRGLNSAGENPLVEVFNLFGAFFVRCQWIGILSKIYSQADILGGWDSGSTQSHTVLTEIRWEITSTSQG